MELILVRHGHAAGQDGRAIGHTDLPLSAEGADAVRAMLGTGEPPPDRLVSSDLRRASESASILAARWGLPIVRDPRLREMHFGEWDGERWETIRARDAGRLNGWMERWWERSTPRGEGWRDLTVRVGDWLSEQRRTAGHGERIGIVTHAGVIRTLVATALGLDARMAFQLECDYASVTRITLGGAGAMLRTLNGDRWRSRLAPAGTRMNNEQSTAGSRE